MRSSIWTCEAVRVGLALVISGLPIGARGALAHDLSRSESILSIDGATVRAQFSINLLEFKGLDANSDGQVTYDELDARLEDIFRLIKQHYTLSAPAQPSRTVMQRQQIVEDHVLLADLVFTFDRAVRDLRVESTLDAATTPSHVHDVRAEISGEIYQALLTPENRSVNFQVSGFTIGRLVIALLAFAAVAGGLAVRVGNRNRARRLRSDA